MAKYENPAMRAWADNELKDITDGWTRAAMTLLGGRPMVYGDIEYRPAIPYHPGEPNPAAPGIDVGHSIPVYALHEACYYGYVPAAETLENH